MPSIHEAAALHALGQYKLAADDPGIARMVYEALRAGGGRIGRGLVDGAERGYDAVAPHVTGTGTALADAWRAGRAAPGGGLSGTEAGLRTFLGDAHGQNLVAGTALGLGTLGAGYGLRHALRADAHASGPDSEFMRALQAQQPQGY